MDDNHRASNKNQSSCYCLCLLIKISRRKRGSRSFRWTPRFNSKTAICRARSFSDTRLYRGSRTTFHPFEWKNFNNASFSRIKKKKTRWFFSSKYVQSVREKTYLLISKTTKREKTKVGVALPPLNWLEPAAAANPGAGRRGEGVSGSHSRLQAGGISVCFATPCNAQFFLFD